MVDAPWPSIDGYLGGYIYLIAFDMFSHDDSPWFITCDRALFVEESGGCWVELSRLRESEELGQVFEELDCAFLGPVQAFA